MDTPAAGHVAHIVPTDDEAADLLVLQLHVPGLDDESLEGGVVGGGELHSDLPARRHQVGAETEVGWRRVGLRRVVVARRDG